MKQVQLENLVKNKERMRLISMSRNNTWFLFEDTKEEGLLKVCQLKKSSYDQSFWFETQYTTRV
jgi:hypothetical protein